MPVDIELDSPRRIFLRTPRNALRTLLGVALLGTGLACSVVAVLLTILVAILVLAWFVVTNEVRAVGLPAPPLFVPAWIASILLTGATSLLGIAVLRGRRRVVLFLRRFGLSEATEVMTFAVASSIGSSWRLVTLDDDDIAPVGVSAGTLRLTRVAGVGTRFGRRLKRYLDSMPQVFAGLAVGMAGIIAYDVFQHRNWMDVWPISIATYLQPVYDVIVAGHLVTPIGWNLTTAFLVLALAMALVVGAAIASLIVFALVIPFAVPLGLVSSTLGSIQKAEKFKRQAIRDPAALESQTKAIASTGRRMFAPRLLVVRVTPDLWQGVVHRLADFSAAIVIDISDPTENLLWEVESLKSRLGDRFIVIGDYHRIAEFAYGGSDQLSAEARLATTLDGQSVLAYTHDRRGMDRFARALRDRLETI